MRTLGQICITYVNFAYMQNLHTYTNLSMCTVLKCIPFWMFNRSVTHFKVTRICIKAYVSSIRLSVLKWLYPLFLPTRFFLNVQLNPKSILFCMISNFTGARLYDGPDLKLFNLVGWDGNFFV